MGDLLLFPKPFRNSEENRRELKALQEWFRATNASMYVDVKYDDYQYLIRRQMLANRLRDKWIVYNGFKDETELPSDKHIKGEKSL